MALELLQKTSVQEGLRELVDTSYSIMQNLCARSETPVLENGADLWEDTWLDSKTMNLYGGLNQDNRPRFKIDHSFDLSRIVDKKTNSDGSISIDKNIYMQSQGTEFIIIAKPDTGQGRVDYAIRADKYENIRKQLNCGNYKAEELEKAGGFKINKWMKPDEIPAHGGWQELAIGKNNASEEEYSEASGFLRAKYVPEAQKKNCFLGGIGMGFIVRTDGCAYGVRPWFVEDSGCRSAADVRSYFIHPGRFLRVPDKSAAGTSR